MKKAGALANPAFSFDYKYRLRAGRQVIACSPGLLIIVPAPDRYRADHTAYCNGESRNHGPYGLNNIRSALKLALITRFTLRQG